MVNTLYTKEALTKLGGGIKTYSRSGPMANFLGTVCADPGIRVVNTGGYIKSYTTLGGMILPYDENGMDEFSAMIATALLVKKSAGDDVEIMFIMGHENCRFMEGIYKVVLGARDKFPIRGRFMDTLLNESFRGELTDAIVKADRRGDDGRYIIRVLTELMLLESLRNFRSHVVDNEADTIADYMDGNVAGVPRLNVIPALTLLSGEVIYFDPEVSNFVRKDDIGIISEKSIDDVLTAARGNYIGRIAEGNYNGLIITNGAGSENVDGKNSGDTRQLAPGDTSRESCA